MKQRKPMSRGTGFKRPEYVRTAPAAPTRGRGGRISMVGAAVVSVCKTAAHRNPHLLAMARGKPCLFRLPGICNFDPETTVAAHSNWAEHGGKGMSRKASDCYSAWSCSACHSWLDQGRADRDSKQMAFLDAHLAQVCEWRAIAGSAAAEPRDRLAAQWALDHLNASPVGELP